MLYRYSSLLVTTIATNLLITSCSPLKPDHPQQYHSFKERRAPRDNQIVASGTLGVVSDEKKSSYTPYWGPEPKQKETYDASTAATATVKATASEIQEKANSAIPPSSDSSNSGSFFDRLMKKLSISSADNQPLSKKVAFDSNRRAPKQNNQEMLDNNKVIEDIGQGSARGTTYYDMADDVTQVNAVPVPKVEVVQLAQNTNAPSTNPSAPLVNVPEMPDDNTLKQQAAKEQSKPELNRVPTIPQPLSQPPAMPSTPAAPVMVAPSVPSEPSAVPTPPMINQPVMPQSTVKAEPEKAAVEENEMKPEPKAKSVITAHKKQHYKKPSHHVDHNVTAYSYPDNKANYDDVVIKDKSAELTTYKGHHIVSGELKATGQRNCIPRPKEAQE